MPKAYGFFKRQFSTRPLLKGFLVVLLAIGFFALPRLASAQTTVISTSSTTTATHPSQMRHIVRSPEGVALHAFVQVGTETATCGGQSKFGLLWFVSTDQGSTWTCEGQLTSNNSMYASAAVGTFDMYVVYSQAAVGAGDTLDVFYRRITPFGGSWILGPEQTVRDGTTSIGYSYASIEVQGDTRLWLTARYFDGTNYQVGAYYSDNQGEAPTWQVSQLTLNTAGTSSVNHIPQVVRFGLSIGVVYLSNSSDTCFRYRPDTWALAKWSIEDCNAGYSPTYAFSAVGHSSGRVYLAFTTNPANYSVRFNIFNGVGWSDSAIPVNASLEAADTSSISISTDGTNVWVYYLDKTGLLSNLPGNRKLVYKKGLPPFEYGDGQFDATPTNAVSSHGTFDKYWSVIFGTWTDDTEDAGDSIEGDTTMFRNLDDGAYWGKLQKFDAISWDSDFGTAGEVAWEYWNGTIWTALTLTSSQNPNFVGFPDSYGYVAFTPPTDWATTQVNGEATPYYYVRVKVTKLYTGAPIGNQMVSIPPINNVSAVPKPSFSQNTIHAIWTENSSSPTKIRSTSTPVTTSSPPSATADIPPRIITATQDQYEATFTPNARNMVRTSDGTLHSFVYVNGKTTVLCSGTPSNGLLWFNSTDFGSTWNCRGQLGTFVPFQGNEKHASATVDFSDNIYVVYSFANPTTRAGTANDVFYRKLTKGAGATWILGPEQLALDGTSTTGYTYAKIIVDNIAPGRLWLVAKYYTTTVGAVVTVYYADDLDDSPTWTQSIAQLSTPGFSGNHENILVSYGLTVTNTAVIYRDDDGKIYMRTHANADPPTSWGAPSLVTSTNPGDFSNASAVASPFLSSNVYLAWVDWSQPTADVKFSYYNGSSWSPTITLFPSITTDACVSFCDYYVNTTMDSSDVWVIAGDYTGISKDLLINGKLSYKHGIYPFGISNFDSSPTPIVFYHGSLDKYWSYVGGSYLDHTAEAASSTAGDTRMVTGVGDIAYFGKLLKFDTLVIDCTLTNAVGGNVVWEYWDGTDWKAIVSFTDYFNNNFVDTTGCPYSFISFIPPSNWTNTSVNAEALSYYYIRARVVTTYTTSPVATQIQTTPWVSFPSVLEFVSHADNIMHLMWTEGQDLDPGYARVRYSSLDTSRQTQAFGLRKIQNPNSGYIGNRAFQTTPDPVMDGNIDIAGGPVGLSTWKPDPVSGIVTFIESGPAKECDLQGCELRPYFSYCDNVLPIPNCQYMQDPAYLLGAGLTYAYKSEWTGGATGTFWDALFCDGFGCHPLLTVDLGLGVTKLPYIIVGGESTDFLIHWGSITATQVKAKKFGETTWQPWCYSFTHVNPDPGPTVSPCVDSGWTATW